MPSTDQTLALFGRNLRRLREAAGLTQEALAVAAERDITYISGIERGRRNPGVLTVLALANALGVPPSDLLEGLKV
jgi:transcriptional regulator with XRE-family HTH domain